MMLKLIIVALLLIPFVSRASDTDDAGLAQIRAAIAMQQAAAALQAATAGIQKVTPPTPVVAPAPDPATTTVSIPADIRDSLVSMAAVLIPGLIGIGLTWMRSHLKIMQDVAMDKSITDSANGFGALLVQSIKKRGLQITDLDVHSPEVASFANSLLVSRPQFTSAMGVSSDKAASLVLKEAAKFTDGAAPVDVVQAAEPKPIVAAAIAPQIQPPTPPIKAPSWPVTSTPIPTKPV